MPKRIASITLPKMVGPSDDLEDMSTAKLSLEVDNQFVYLLKKQQKLRGLCIQTQNKKKVVHKVVGKEEGTHKSMGKEDTGEETKKLLDKCIKLTELSETRLRKLCDTIKQRNEKMCERLELSKGAIIREVVQTRRTGVNWYGPHIIVTPLDATIAARQGGLADHSMDILGMESALDVPIEL